MKTNLMAFSPLERYGYNLTDIANQGLFPPLRGFEKLVMHIVQILHRREKTNNRYNPLLLSLDQMSQWRVVFEVARRIAANETPEPLPIQKVIALNYEALLADLPDSLTNLSSELPQRSLPTEGDWNTALASKSDSMLEQLLQKYFPKGLWPSLEAWEAPDAILSRMQALFLDVYQAGGSVLLFVNHFHWLLEGGPEKYAIDASTLLKPTLARRQIQLIAACTPDQYQRYIEHDAAISRRFQEIYLDLG